MKKNIIFNHTLEEYNKKYRNRKYRLLKFTKKELEELDKKDNSNTKYHLLKDRKWWFIKDTYYEIPKPIRFTWFRNLNAACQVGTCLLLAGGVVATSIAVPLVLLNQNKGPSITIDGADYDIEASHIELHKDSYIVLKEKEGKSISDVEEVKVGGKVITRDTEWTFNKENKKVNIKAEAMTSTKIEIKVVIEEPTKETDKEKFIRLAHEYIYGADGFANSKKEYKKSDIQNVCLYGEEQTDFTATYETNEFGRVFEIDSDDYYYDFGTCQYYTDEKLNDMLLDAKENHTTYEFTNDYISYTTDECKKEYGAEKCLVINKFGYVTKEIYYDDEFGGWCDSYITFKNEPKEPEVEEIELTYDEEDKSYENRNITFKANTNYKFKANVESGKDVCAMSFIKLGASMIKISSFIDTKSIVTKQDGVTFLNPLTVNDFYYFFEKPTKKPFPTFNGLITAEFKTLDTVPEGVCIVGYYTDI